MIVIDASAIVAILAEEAEGEAFSQLFGEEAPAERFVSTVSIWEAACAVARLKKIDRHRGLEWVSNFRALTSTVAVPPDMTITSLAIEAAQRFGQGAGYPGILNLGDCFSYATAKHLGAALLFKGDDFTRTDIQAA